MKLLNIKRMLALSTMLPMGAAWAHLTTLAYQGEMQQNLWTMMFNGLLHTLSGIDHLLLALGLGYLLFKLSAQLKPITGCAIAASLLIGFAVGSLQWISSELAEIGILWSLVLMLIAFWKQQSAWLVLLMVSISCHGIAHGIAVSSLSIVNQFAFMWGMMLSFMLVIFLGMFAAHYFNLYYKDNAFK